MVMNLLYYLSSYLLRLIAHPELVETAGDAVLTGELCSNVGTLFNLVAPRGGADFDARLGGVSEAAAEDEENEDQLLHSNFFFHLGHMQVEIIIFFRITLSL